MSPLWALISGEPNALAEFLSFAVAIVIGITVHEFAHAKAAQMAGDPTPGQHGRVTLNPLVHFDPIGTIFLLLAGFGWGRPVPVNPFLMRRPRPDNVLVSLWGPLSNFLVALVFALPFRLEFLLPDRMAAGYVGGVLEPYGIVLGYIIMMNLVLGTFNLLPIYPLDGSHIVSGLLPLPQARKYDLFIHQYGLPLLLLLFVSSRFTLHYLIWVPVHLLFSLLTGRMGVY
jgi:Zn-dependent protease